MSSNHESVLEELLRDPIIRLVMASDGVHADEIRRLFKEVRTPAAQPALVLQSQCSRMRRIDDLSVGIWLPR